MGTPEAETKVLEFPATPRGQSQKVNAVEEHQAQGWKVVSEIIVPPSRRDRKGAQQEGCLMALCSTALCWPCALAGFGVASDLANAKGTIVLTLERSVKGPYSVIIEERVKYGVLKEDVKYRLEKVSDIEEAKLPLLFRGPLVVKKGLDLWTAEAHVRVYDQAGAICRIVAESEPAPSDAGRSSTPEQQSEAPPRYCTRCGAVLVQNARLCTKCGAQVPGLADLPTPTRAVPASRVTKSWWRSLSPGEKKVIRFFACATGALVLFVLIAQFIPNAPSLPRQPSDGQGRCSSQFCPGDSLVNVNNGVDIGVVTAIEESHTFRDGSVGRAYIIRRPNGVEMDMNASVLEEIARRISSSTPAPPVKMEMPPSTVPSGSTLPRNPEHLGDQREAERKAVAALEGVTSEAEGVMQDPRGVVVHIRPEVWRGLGEGERQELANRIMRRALVGNENVAIPIELLVEGTRVAVSVSNPMRMELLSDPTNSQATPDKTRAAPGDLPSQADQVELKQKVTIQSQGSPARLATTDQPAPRRASRSGETDYALEIQLVSGSRIMAGRAWAEEDRLLYERHGVKGSVRLVDVDTLVDENLEALISSCSASIEESSLASAVRTLGSKQAKREYTLSWERTITDRQELTAIGNHTDEAVQACAGAIIKKQQNSRTFLEAKEHAGRAAGP